MYERDFHIPVLSAEESERRFRELVRDELKRQNDGNPASSAWVLLWLLLWPCLLLGHVLISEAGMHDLVVRLQRVEQAEEARQK
jgi:hypothetical protein